MLDLHKIEKKWQKKWEQAKIFEANPDERPKFFATFPYPYINAYQHIGHFFTLMRVDTFARYKRHKGFNVLFPQGWHATGSPIVNAAKRVKDREKKQIKIMHDMGFTDEEIPKFEKPEYWVEFFVPKFEKDYKSVGMSVDWRRSFYTTSLNPYYDKFIRWQFRKLKEKGYVIQGKFPVVWDPKEKCPVGDHARVEGEGETPQEFTLIKMKFENSDEFIVVATLRPETQFGQTNVWIGADIEYVKAKINSNNVKDEIWVMSEQCANKLKEQDKKVEIIGKIKGRDLIGKKCYAYKVEKYIPILPSDFCDPNKGSGIVTSVPSDAPDDYMGLVDLQNDPELVKSYGLDPKEIKKIKVIPIIVTPGLGDTPGVKVCNELKIKNQNDRKKLEKAKKLVYKKGFYEGKMNKNCRPYAGMPVQVAKEKIKEELIKEGKADILYELTGKVVSRTLTECIVKIVDDQWFLNYNDPEWKKLAHKCVSKMNFFPEKARVQFEYVIDWLHEWACTREEGLGTKLPWDEKWLIESLSDSTIYMAYYTIAHLIKKVPIEKINDAFFDYIFLNQGDKPNVANIDEMKANFEYFYPVDFRNSGKDLIQNHLTFYIFNHVAIFPEKYWPKSIGANGWVTIDGQKMSKSLGNMIPVREMVKRFTADASRLTTLNGGEEMDDPNWDTEFAKSMVPKLSSFHDFCKENCGKYKRGGFKQIDAWFESELNRIIKTATEAMELTLFRTAIQNIYFDMQRIVKYYLKRTRNDPNKNLMNKFIETQLIMLAPFTPHICEEIWEAIGKEGFISTVKWPDYDESKINEELNVKEQYLEQVISDIRTVKQLAKLDKIKKIKIFVSDSWKYQMFDIIAEELKNENRDFKSIFNKIISNDDLKVHGKEISKMLPMLLKKGLPEYLSVDDECNLLNDSTDIIKGEFSAELEIIKAQDSKEPKAKQAMPSKPAILLE